MSDCGTQTWVREMERMPNGISRDVDSAFLAILPETLARIFPLLVARAPTGKPYHMKYPKDGNDRLLFVATDPVNVLVPRSFRSALKRAIETMTAVPLNFAEKTSSYLFSAYKLLPAKELGRACRAAGLTRVWIEMHGMEMDLGEFWRRFLVVALPDNHFSFDIGKVRARRCQANFDRWKSTMAYRWFSGTRAGKKARAARPGYPPTPHSSPGSEWLCRLLD